MASTLVPAGVGAVFGFSVSYLLWVKQRDWQREQVRFERQLEIVRTLDTALVEAERRMSRHGLEEGEDRWYAAYREWSNGWVRASPFLADHELRERYESVGTLLSELSLYEADSSRSPLMRKAALQAISNTRIGIAYFGREEELPPSCFPQTDELFRLLGEGDPEPFLRSSPLGEWLKAHPAPPWHPKREQKNSS